MAKKISPSKILTIDIGGTGLKGCLLDAAGNFIEDYHKQPTPKPANPENILAGIQQMAATFSGFDAVSVGFPGYVRDGRVHTAPNLDNETWKNVQLDEVISRLLGKPCKVVNDADLAGMGIAAGNGLEMVMTLGTGFGTALLNHGQLLPHLELSHAPATKNKDFDAYIGEAALQAIGEKKWNERMLRVLDIFKTVVNYDFLYIGGGNAKKLQIPLDHNIKIVHNRDGIKGGAKLWR
jgi:polyphosphate glucokinase